MADKYGVRRIYATVWDEAATKPEWELYRQFYTRLGQWGLRDRFRIICNVPSSTLFEQLVDLKTGRRYADILWTYDRMTDEILAKIRQAGLKTISEVTTDRHLDELRSHVSRYHGGLRAWRFGSGGGTNWAYNSYYGSAQTFLDGPDWGEGSIMIYPDLGRRLDYEIHRVGLFDLRYIRTLERLIRGAAKRGKKTAEAARAQAYLDRVWKQIDVRRDAPFADDARYDQVKRQVAEHILRLQ